MCTLNWKVATGYSVSAKLELLLEGKLVEQAVIVAHDVLNEDAKASHESVVPSPGRRHDALEHHVEVVVLCEPCIAKKAEASTAGARDLGQHGQPVPVAEYF